MSIYYGFATLAMIAMFIMSVHGEFDDMNKAHASRSSDWINKCWNISEMIVDANIEMSVQKEESI